MARTPWKMYLFPGRCSCEFCEMAKKLTLILKLNSQLKLEIFFFPLSEHMSSQIWKNFSILTICLSSLFKEIQPFENYKIHRNVLEIHFSHDPKLPGTCMYECEISLGDTCRNSLGARGGGGV